MSLLGTAAYISPEQNVPQRGGVVGCMLLTLRPASVAGFLHSLDLC